MQGDAPVIEAQNIGVKFSVYGSQQSMKHRVINTLFRPKLSFWALRRISFTVRHGETFFIIGRNGAGKTTLLKVLAETLFPDEGSVTVWGEITAFLSMGLGFRLELSGRDNMDLALHFLGAAREDIARYSEGILSFTQLEDFIDMPIKTYSAGMQARLAFAIATSVRPEILLMDEVINAGDEEFSGRCRERLEEMLQKAKAIVVCTHNLQNAITMADRVMWIEQGEIRAIGEANHVVQEYLSFIKHVRLDPFYDLKAQQARVAADQ